MEGNERNMNGKKKKMEGHEWKWKEKQSLRTSIFLKFWNRYLEHKKKNILRTSNDVLSVHLEH